MPFINSLTKAYLNYRLEGMRKAVEQPIAGQQKILKKIIEGGKNTLWMNQYNGQKIKNEYDYAEKIPLQDYESLFPYIKRMMQGEKNILWNQAIQWFAQSSGTSNAKSKFIPVSTDMLTNGHYKAGRDVMSWHVHQCPATKLFQGQSLILGGSYKKLENSDARIKAGDISAVMMENLPWAGAYFSALPKNIAVQPDWMKKMSLICNHTSNKNITQIAGVPSWIIALLQFILKANHKNHVLQIWENLELYVHGGVSFVPYQNEFAELTAHSKQIKYCETYNATEGFFGIQNEYSKNDMLLLTNHGVYYELLPIYKHQESQSTTCVSLKDARLDTIYELVISTYGGLWRYRIGDTIQFTSLFPFRFKIVGRTQHYINTFGEELMVANAEKAIQQTAAFCQIGIKEFTVAPAYLGEGKGRHDWLIEFETMPQDMNAFEIILDKNLQEINTDYAAKRQQNLILEPLKIIPAPRGAFYLWLKSKNKLGGQNKVIRLSPNRLFFEELLLFITNTHLSEY